MGFRQAARKDGNHQEIVKAFKKCGWSVLDIAQLKNCCDLFVARRGYVVAVEIKDPTQPPSKRRLTDGEKKFFERWSGPTFVVHTEDDVRLLTGVAGAVSIESVN